MDFYFSRHAKGRAKLYNIALEDIVEILDNLDVDYFEEGQNIEIVDSRFLNKYKYPLKIVLKKEESKLIIITKYPLKRRLYEN